MIFYFFYHFRIFFGDSGPFFALVGVSLASGAGLITKEEELEGVCFEIRVIFLIYLHTRHIVYIKF